GVEHVADQLGSALLDVDLRARAVDRDALGEVSDGDGERKDDAPEEDPATSPDDGEDAGGGAIPAAGARPSAAQREGGARHAGRKRHGAVILEGVRQGAIRTATAVGVCLVEHLLPTPSGFTARS